MMIIIIAFLFDRYLVHFVICVVIDHLLKRLSQQPGAVGAEDYPRLVFAALLIFLIRYVFERVFALQVSFERLQVFA